MVYGHITLIVFCVVLFHFIKSLDSIIIVPLLCSLVYITLLVFCAREKSQSFIYGVPFVSKLTVESTFKFWVDVYNLAGVSECQPSQRLDLASMFIILPTFWSDSQVSIHLVLSSHSQAMGRARWNVVSSPAVLASHSVRVGTRLLGMRLVFPRLSSSGSLVWERDSNVNVDSKFKRWLNCQFWHKRHPIIFYGVNPHKLSLLWANGCAIATCRQVEQRVLNVTVYTETVHSKVAVQLAWSIVVVRLCEIVTRYAHIHTHKESA